MEKLIRDAIKRGDTEMFLDTPPDFIIASLSDRKTHKSMSKYTLPEDFQFASRRKQRNGYDSCWLWARRQCAGSR